jgi:hypothetical protein
VQGDQTEGEEVSQTPSIGRIVTVVGFEARSNGTDIAPAIITRIWDERPDGAWTVNLRVFPDAGIERNATSILLWPDEDTARAAISEYETMTAAHWPARV